MNRKDGNKKWIKYAVPALLLLVAAAVFFQIREYRKEHTFAGNKKASASSNMQVARGVVDSIDQLPQYGTDTTAKQGSVQNPFVILEIVPYEEYAEYGYLIDGCEPTAVEDMFGDGDLQTIASINRDKGISTSTIQDECYFFSDEKASKNKYYDGGSIAVIGETYTDDDTTYRYDYQINGNDYKYEEVSETATDGAVSTKKVISSKESVYDKDSSKYSKNVYYGYYELVKDGEGDFVQNDGKIEKSEKGNLIWHTVNDDEKAEKFSTRAFSNSLAKDLKYLGDRIYTTRKATKSDPIKIVAGKRYTYYMNQSLFLTDTLALTKSKARKYNIVVKTITPNELNSTPEWIDYTDLFVLSGKIHLGNNLVDIWKDYNRLGHSSSVTDYASTPYFE